MDINKIIEDINIARKNKDYITSDRLRKELIDLGYKLKIDKGIVNLDINKREKCGFCKKLFEKLNKCSVLSEGKRVYGRPPGYFRKFPEFCKENNIEKEHYEWGVGWFKYLFLCDECSNIEHTLKHCKVKFTPFIIGVE